MEPHILLQMPLFRGITEETLLKFILLHQHTLKSYKSGEFIAMQGDIYRSLYILCKEQCVRKWSVQKENNSP